MPPLPSGFFSRHRRVFSTLAFLFLYSAGISFALPPGTKYQPGGTLDPNCTPGSSNCSVQILPDQTNSGGGVLTTDGNTTNWTKILTNLTLITPAIASISNGGTLSLPSTTDTLVARNTTDTLTNKTLSAATNTITNLTNANLSGSANISNANLANSTISGTPLGGTLPTLTFGTDLSGTSYNGTGAVTINDVSTLATITGRGASTSTAVAFNGGMTSTTGTFTGLLTLTSGLGLTNTSPGINAQYADWTNTGGTLRWGIENNVGGVLFTNSLPYAGVLGTRGATAFHLATNNATRLTIDASGNVGVGTTNPARIFTINGGANTARVLLQNNTTGSTIGNGFDIYEDLGGNAALWNYYNAPIQFATNNIERMRIDNAGNVGIGTTTPTTKLQISGSGGVVSTITATDNQGATSAYANTVQSWAAGLLNNVGITRYSIYDSTNAKEAVSILSSTNNVGLGITTPQRRLDVSSAGTPSQVRLTGNPTGLEFYNTSGIVSNWLLAAQDVTDHALEIIPSTLDGGTTYTTPVVTFKSNGNVGIGNTATTNIDANANIRTIIGSSTGTTQGTLDLVANTTGTANGVGLVQWGNYNIVGAEKRIAILEGITDGATNSGRLNFYTNTAGTLGIKMMISSAGNVGIGTTAPAGRLEVTGGTTHTLYVDAPTDVGAHYGLEVRGAQNAYTAYFLGNGTTGQSAGLNIQAGTNSSDGPLDVFNFAGTELFRVRGDGNVGIGTTNPGARFQVTDSNGQVAVINSTSGVGAYLTFQDNGTAKGLFGVGATLFSNGGTGIRSLGTTPISFAITSATPAMVIDTTSNIGIGTTSPTSLLTVSGSQPASVATAGTAATQVVAITGGKGGNTTGTTGQTGGTGAVVNITAGQGGDAPTGSTNGNGGDIQIYPGAPGSGLGTAGTYGNVLLAGLGGKVGIGTTPNSTLDVNGNINSNGYLQVGTQFPNTDRRIYAYSGIARTANSYGIVAGNADSSTTASVGKYGGYFYSNGSNSGSGAVNVGIYVTASGGATNYAAIFYQGNVGIGTTAPLSPLHIAQDNDGLRITRAAGTYGFKIYSDVAGGGYINMDVGNSTAGFNNIFRINEGVTNAVQTLYILQNGGKVGIGTISPQKTLDINGGLVVRALNAGDSLWSLSSPTTSGQGGMIFTQIGPESAAAGTSGYKIYTTGTGSATGIYHLGFISNLTTPDSLVDRMVVDGNGQVGLGINPAPWGSGFRALQIATGAAIWGHNDGVSPTLYLSSNTYYDGTNWKVLTSATQKPATLQVYNGALTFYSNAAGAAGSIFTPTQVFSVDNSGNISTNGGLYINSGTTSAMSIVSAGANYVYFRDNNNFPRQGFETTGNSRMPFDMPNVAGTSIQMRDYTGAIQHSFDVSGGYNANGQGRFKGWYVAGTGPAAEIGVTGSQAVIIGYDRTAAAYIPIVMSGSTLSLQASGYGTAMIINNTGDINHGLWTSVLPSHNATYQQAIFGGLDIMYRNALDGQINSNATYNATNQYVASYTSTAGIGVLAFSGGTMSWYANSASVTAGTAYTIANVFSVTPAGVPTFAGLVSCGGIQTNASGTMSCTSDQRLKDIQGPFTVGLSAIRQINPQSFSWKKDSGLYDNGFIYYGFIAQNIQQAVPQAITTSYDGHLQVSQLTLLATAINAIKELDVKVQVIPDFADQTMYAKITAFLQGIAQGLSHTDRVETQNLCVGSVCVTEQQFLQMVTHSQPTASAPASTPAPAAPTPVPTPTTQTAPTTSTPPATSTTSSTTPAPTTAPSTAVTPAPTPAPTTTPPVSTPATASPRV